MSNRSWRAKWTLGIGIALIGYTLAGFFLLPAIIKSQMLKRLPALTKRIVTIQQVKLNPFALTLTIRGFTLKETNGDVFYSFDELSANLRPTSIFKRVFLFKEIRLKKPFGSAIFQHDGKFNFSNLLSALPPETKTKIQSHELPRFVVERLSIKDGALVFHDLNRKVLLKLSRIGLTMAGLSNQTNAPVSTVISLVCNESGTVALQGTVSPFARSADFQVQVTNLDLRAIQPYVEEVWNLEITGGALTAEGRVLYTTAGHAAPLVQFTGQLGVANFTSVDTEARAEFLKLDSLTLTGLDLRYLPHGLDVAAINVVGLRGNMVILPDKSSNWKGMVNNAQQLQELIVKLQLNKLFPFQIGTVSFENCSFGFADRSIEPNVVSEIQEVSGTVAGLSSAATGTMRVDLHGKVDEHSTVTLEGTMNPLADDLKIDLTLSLKNGEMTPGSPYAAKFVGYPIHQGQLSLEAHYTVNQRVLKADNKFSARQLKLGAKDDSPDATQLRIKLAIALLQDRDGVLAFDVLVNGNLDDPQFKLGPVITQMFMNIVLKAVSNPFALLGSLVGSREQLSFVSFEPGRSNLADGETKKLDTLAKALFARPGVELEITGSADTTNDRFALARIKLHQELKSRRIKELIAAGKVTGPADTFQIDTQDYERLIHMTYLEVVGTKPVVTAEPPSSTGPEQNFGPGEPSGGETNLLSRLPPPVAKAFADLTLADAEARIIETIEVTPDDFRVLMQARADNVQKYLLQTGQVDAERMFIIAPKPVDPSYQGQSRVDLSLQ
jgi:outer membrane protein OmpA-like peptidoglycan-associated protein